MVIPARRSRPWRARLTPGLVAAALAMSGEALPYSLSALLQMPLERLLELKVVPRRSAQAGLPEAATAQGPFAGGGWQHVA